MLTRREEQTPTHCTHPQPQEAVLSLVPCVLAEKNPGLQIKKPGL